MKLILSIFLATAATALSAQIKFSNFSSRMADPNCNSGNAIAIADMNGDCLDDIVRLDSSLNFQIEFQPATGTQFTSYKFGVVGGDQWGMCIADVDGNGINDMFTGGSFNGLKLFTGNTNGSSWTKTTLGGPGIFLQACNFVDINNDGDIDLFALNDVGISSAYRGDGTGNFVYDTPALINPVSSAYGMGPTDNSGNYGSVWSDYDNDGDIDLYLSRCRQGVSNPLDGRRINQLFNNDGGTYIDTGVYAGVVPFEQSWAADFGDINNDGLMDLVVVHHSAPPNVYTNNGNGTFADISFIAGVTYGVGLEIQVAIRDFDNDTYNDILISGTGGSNFFHNDGGTGLMFTEMSDDSIPDDELYSFALGDLNHDGFVDIYGSYGAIYTNPTTNPDKILLNDGNSNEFINLTLKGVTSNPNGIGSRLEAYGGWTGGIQIRDVRGGESYGIMHSMSANFGLGTGNDLDSIIVKWPSGTKQTLTGLNKNSFLCVTEGPDCVVANFGLTLIGDDVCDGEDGTVTISNSQSHVLYQAYVNDTTALGVPTLGNGGNLQLTVGTSNLVIGSNTIKIYADATCVEGFMIASATIQVTAVPANPNISETFPGILTASSAAASYTWTVNGIPLAATTQSIAATQAGTYVVVAWNGSCSSLSSGTLVYDPTAIAELGIAPKIEITPNPSTGIFNLMYDGPRIKTNVVVSDLTGRVLENRERELISGVTQKLDLTAHPQGVYFVRMQIGEGSKTRKVVVQR